MADDTKNLLIKAKYNCEVAKLAEDKHYFDVSVSRYYYAVYQTMIYIIRKKEPGYEPESGKGSHIDTNKKFMEIVRQYYVNNLKFNEQLYIKTFSSLKKVRKKADYSSDIITQTEYSKGFIVDCMNFYNVLNKLKSL